MLDFLCLFGITWTSAFEQTPADTDNPGEGDNRIREGKVETRSRADQEHVWLGTASTGETIHRAGTARAYYQTTAPTLRPDGVTALGAGDAGRLYVNATTKGLFVWNGSAFSEIEMDFLLEQENSEQYQVAVFEIGDWNMDSTASASVTHGLDYTLIRDVHVIIKNDADTVRYKIEGAEGMTFVTPGGYLTITSTTIDITRYAGSIFDSADFNSTSYNRGYVTIFYSEA